MKNTEPVLPMDGDQALSEAWMIWGDPDVVAELTRLADQGCDIPAMVWNLDRDLDAFEEGVFRYRELRDQLQTALLQMLQTGMLVATGYDSRAAINAPPVEIPPDRWRVLKPDFGNSTAKGAGIEVGGIMVFKSSRARAVEHFLEEERLWVDKSAKRARFDGCNLKLTPRSFGLLVILAEAAVEGTSPVQKRRLEDDLLAGNFNRKALTKAVSRLRDEVIKSGIAQEVSRNLIENYHATGYRLNLQSSDIQIVSGSISTEA